MRRVALIGLHGSGKGAAGRALRSLGYVHWSIGDIRRRLWTGDLSDDLPALLVAAVRRAKAGSPLPATAVRAILSAAERQPRCAIDGVPDGVEHVACFDAGWTVLHIRCQEDLRQSRLRQRALESARLWIDGVNSPRDARLASTIAALPPAIVRTIDNDGSLDDLRDRIVTSLIDGSVPGVACVEQVVP